MTNPQRPRAGPRMGLLSVAVVMTGGTIAKSYNPAEARLYNFEPKVKEIIAGLRTDDLRFTYMDLLHLDSLEIRDADRDRIASAVADACRSHDAVLVTHGTDGMAQSGALLCAQMADIPVPVVFTGAMVPFAVKGSDAVQNVTEALLALRFLPPGAYIVLHNRVLALPGVKKDHTSLTFAES